MMNHCNGFGLRGYILSCGWSMKSLKAGHQGALTEFLRSVTLPWRIRGADSLDIGIK